MLTVSVLSFQPLMSMRSVYIYSKLDLAPKITSLENMNIKYGLQSPVVGKKRMNKTLLR